ATPLPLLLMGLQRGRRRLMLGLTALCLLLFVGIKFVISPIAGFGSIGPHYGAIVPIHIIGAVVKEGHPLGAADKALIEEVFPLQSWRDRYHCQNVGALFFTEPRAYPVMAAKRLDLAALAGRL